MLYTGSLQSVNLSARATDGDGYVQQVAFYANGELVGVDTSSPYEGSFDINGSGLYEVYAVASDDDGNDITSTVQRIKVLEPGDIDEPLSLEASATSYLGGVGQVTALYKSPSGLSYANAVAYVYVNGEYAGIAEKLPRSEPAPGEDDPGQGFRFDLAARNVSGYEVEFVLVNTTETFTAGTNLSVIESALTNDYEFLKALYLGLYNREPAGFEISRYLLALSNGSLTREGLIEELRGLSEFRTARDNLILHKTLLGEWRTTQIVLADLQNVTDGNATGTTGGTSAGAGTRPDDGDQSNTATLVGMNETIDSSINRVDDVDWFRVEGIGQGRDGLLVVEIAGGHTGVEVISSNDRSGAANSQKVLEVFENGSSVATSFIRPSFFQRTGGGRGANSGGTESPLMFAWDLSGVTSANPNYRFRILLSDEVGANELAQRGGLYTLRIRNDAFLQIDGSENSLIENVESLVEAYDPQIALPYLTSKFSYVNQYGDIESHNPEEFFTRLFRNKYEQDPSPLQVARGVELINSSDFTQLAFLEAMAMDNGVVSAGSYN